MATWQQWEGQVVNGRFPLHRYLGGSEQSAVYLTEIDGLKAAIKLIPADAAQAQIQVSRWELASKLSHPHLLRILHTGRCRADDQRDVHFAVMEYGDENLGEILPSRLLTPAEVSEMLVPTLDALNYLHEHGLVHGNVKPANIMAVSDELKLSSDGIRRMGASEEASGDGTPYDAPENATRAISPSSDIWSLGMTLVEVLSNRLPACDRTAENDPELPENIPHPFDDIARHCLRRDPVRRWSTAEIRTRLERAVPVARKEDVVSQQISPVAEAREFSATATRRGVASSEARETIVESSGPKEKPRAGRVAAAVIIALVLIAAGVRLFRHSSQTPQPASTTSPQPNTPSPLPLKQPADLPTSRTNASVGQGAVAHEVLPDVPQKARDTISGTVKVNVQVAVDTSGAVSHAALVSSGGSGYFANQALQAARKWTFTPPTAEGKAMPSEWSLRFEFKRNGTKAVPQRTSPSL